MMPADVGRKSHVVVVQYDALLKAAKGPPSNDGELADLERKIEQVLAPDLSL